MIIMPNPVTLAIVEYSCIVGFLAITRTLLAEEMNAENFSNIFTIENHYRLV